MNSDIDLTPPLRCFLKVMLNMCFRSNSLAGSDHLAPSRHSSATSERRLAVCQHRTKPSEVKRGLEVGLCAQD